jgi:hypothetical protein
VASDTARDQLAIVKDFNLERYKYILQQINATNENVYRTLTLYQTLVTAITGGAIGLFVGYKQWQLEPAVARSGVVALLWLQSLVAVFSVVLIAVGILNWLDYRNEECDLTDLVVYPGFRQRPRSKNLLRWHETYIILFIIGTCASIWIVASLLLIPAIA